MTKAEFDKVVAEVREANAHRFVAIETEAPEHEERHPEIYDTGAFPHV